VFNTRRRPPQNGTKNTFLTVPEPFRRRKTVPGGVNRGQMSPKFTFGYLKTLLTPITHLAGRQNTSGTVTALLAPL
jgi:hypothetical protein